MLFTIADSKIKIAAIICGSGCQVPIYGVIKNIQDFPKSPTEINVRNTTTPL
jgi:hypothetical protein